MVHELCSSATILVVDDQEVVSRVVTRLLTHVGFTVLEATSGDEALDIVRQRQPPIDLVLSDVNMPGMDGAELAAWILAECPGPLVVLMSGKGGRPVNRWLIEGQAVRVLQKPLDLDDLLELLRALVPALPPVEEPEPIGLAR